MTWFIYPLIAAVAVFLLLQHLVMRRARQSEGRPAPDTWDVDGPAQADRRRLYFFHARHCGPCRAALPLVEKLRSEHRNLIKVDIADSPELARSFGIAATPSFVLVEDGSIAQVKLGGQSEAQLRRMLAGPCP